MDKYIFLYTGKLWRSLSQIITNTMSRYAKETHILSGQNMQVNFSFYIKIIAMFVNASTNGMLIQYSLENKR